MLPKNVFGNFFTHSLKMTSLLATFFFMASPTSHATQTDPAFPLVNILPSPPIPNSAGAHYDEKIYQKNQKLQNTPRWTLATQDAKLDVDSILHNFSCAVGVALTPDTAPITAKLVRFIKKHTYDLTQFEKSHWHHPRPINIHPNNPICTEEKREDLTKSPSYPSGHTVLLWSVALTLAEALPQQGPSLAQRGILMSDSRKVCGVHWASDVNAGYLTASYLVSQFHTLDTYRTLLADAHDELQHLKQTSPSIQNSLACVSEKHFIDTLNAD